MVFVTPPGGECIDGPVHETPYKCAKNVANGPETRVATILQRINTYSTRFNEMFGGCLGLSLMSGAMVGHSL